MNIQWTAHVFYTDVVFVVVFVVVVVVVFAVVVFVIGVIRPLKQPQRRRQRERHKTIGLISCTFLSRPLQNNNVKWPISKYYGECEHNQSIKNFINVSLSVLAEPKIILFKKLVYLTKFIKYLTITNKIDLLYNS